MAVDTRLHDKIFRHYVDKMNGCFVVVSNDELFCKSVRGCFKFLALRYDSLHLHKYTVNLVKIIKSCLVMYSQVILIVERTIEGKNCIAELKGIKEYFGIKLKVIVITNETDKNNIAYIHEMGSDNIIVKPVSANSVIEKVALTISPNTEFEGLVEKCKQCIDQNKLDDATIITIKLDKLKPKSSISYMLKGDIAKKKKDFSKAEKYYIEAHHFSKLHLEPYKRLVSLAEDKNEPIEKLKYLKKLDTLSPLNYERKLDIGSTHIQMGEVEEGKQYFSEAIETVKKHSNDLLSKTMMDVGKSLKDIDPVESLRYMKESINMKGNDLNKEDLWLFNQLGVNLRAQGNPEEATNYYQKALKISPKDSVILYNLGMAYAEMKEFNSSIEYFNQAIEANSELLNLNVSVPFNIGMVFYKNKDMDMADQMFKMARVVDPTHETVEKMLRKVQQEILNR